MPIIIYTNIDNSYSACGNGLSATPYNYFQISAGMGTSGDFVLVRGTRTGSTLYFGKSLSGGNVTYQPWDLGLYGPYMLSASTSISLSVGGVGGNLNQIRQGIFVANNIIYDSDLYFPNSMEFRTCLFDGTFVYYKTSTVVTDKFYGCTFANGDFVIDLYHGDAPYSASADFHYNLFVNYPFLVSDVSDTSGNINFYDNATTLSEVVQFSGISAMTYNSARNKFSQSSDLITQFASLNSYTSASLAYENFSVGIPSPISNSSRSDWFYTYDINEGLSNTPRRGYGAFYFSPYIYVDLNNTGSNIYGSSAYPLDYNTFIVYIGGTLQSVWDGDIIKIKGNIGFNSNLSINANAFGGTFPVVTLEDWDASIYGPWVLYSTTNGCTIGCYTAGPLGTTTIIKNMVYVSNKFLALNSSHYTLINCYIGLKEVNSSNVWQTSKITDTYGTGMILGCTINKGDAGANKIKLTGAWAGYGGGAQSLLIKDSVIVGTTLFDNLSSSATDPLTINIDNSVLQLSAFDLLKTSTTNDYTISATGINQVGWGAPIYSAWPNPSSFTQNDWKYSVLGLGITIPGSETWTA